MNSKVAQQWIDTLRQERWNASVFTARDYARYARVPRWWKRVYDLRQLAPSNPILEVGCGAGTQLIPLAAQGFQVTGLDVSPDALERCRHLIAQVEKFHPRPLSVTLLLGDFAQMQPPRLFPLVFSFGVIEHFIDRTERLAVLRKLYEWTAPGGACVNCVPNGMQPLRRAMREKKLGGYNIPEIDYKVKTLGEEMLEAGFAEAEVVCLDLFGYRLVLTSRSSLTWALFRVLNLFFKVLPRRFLPLGFQERHAYILASVARKAKG